MSGGESLCICKQGEWCEYCEPPKKTETSQDAIDEITQLKKERDQALADRDFFQRMSKVSSDWAEKVEKRYDPRCFALDYGQWRILFEKVIGHAPKEHEDFQMGSFGGVMKMATFRLTDLEAALTQIMKYYGNICTWLQDDYIGYSDARDKRNCSERGLTERDTCPYCIAQKVLKG